MSRVNYQGRRRVDNDTLAYSIKSSKFENASHDEPFAIRLVNELVQSWQKHCNVENRRIRELEIKPLKKINTTTNQSTRILVLHCVDAMYSFSPKKTATSEHAM